MWFKPLPHSVLKPTIDFRSRRHALARRYARRHWPSEGITIVSDDCWGGLCYGEFKVPCPSPFLGMGFTPVEYMEFLQRMREPDALKVLSVSSRTRNYPIIQTPVARLFGKHQTDESFFVNQIKRRRSKIKWDRLWIKVDFCRRKYRQQDVETWNELQLPNALAFFPDLPEFHERSIHAGVCLPKRTEDRGQLPAVFRRHGLLRYVQLV